MTLIDKSQAAPPPAWVNYYPNTNGSSANSMGAVADTSGNVYVTGFAAKPNQSIAADTVKYLANGQVGWIASLTAGTISNPENFGKAIALDTSGNTYVAADGLDMLPTHVNTWDIKVVKYNSLGAQQWVAVYDGPGNTPDYATGVAVDSSGNTYVTGSSGNLGGTTALVLLKYNTSGVLQWARTTGNAAGTRVALDPSGNIYVGGTIGLQKYDSSGTLLWTTSGVSAVTSIAIDRSANPFVAGGTSIYKIVPGTGAISWSKPGRVSVVADTSSNVYTVSQTSTSIGVIKYAGNTGTMLWSNAYVNATGAFGLTTTDPVQLVNRYQLIGVDATNACVYVQGMFTPTSSSIASTVIAKFNSTSGTLAWSDIQAGQGLGTADGQAVIDFHGGVFSVGTANLNLTPAGAGYMTVKYTN